MKKIYVAMMALLVSGTAHATAGESSLPLNVTTQVQGGTVCIETFSLNWTSSSVGCGLWQFYPTPGVNARWYDDGARCPTSIPAQAFLTETPCPTELNFNFHLTLTDDSSGNTGMVTLNNQDSATGWVTLHLAISVDGRSYHSGDPIAPASGITSFIKIVPSLYSSSSAGCYDFGSENVGNNNPPNCGHAMTGPTPGTDPTTTGQTGGHYVGTATAVVYM